MEEAKRKHKQFDKDFKLSAVKMVTEGGHKACEVARSLDIHPNMLYSWKRKFANSGEKAFPGKGHLTEIAALRRELREVQMERDILKKAVGIFSKTTENGSPL
jgi:transposase